MIKFDLVWLQTSGVLPYFANFRLISELSTPFVNQRYVGASNPVVAILWYGRNTRILFFCFCVSTLLLKCCDSSDSTSPLRWFYEALKYPRSHQLVVLNGVLMAVVFFLVRIAVMPSYWVSVFATFGTPDFERLGLGAQVAWITSCIALDILNTIWMYKIARGCYKVLTGRGGRQKVKDGAEASSSSDRKHANSHTD